VQLVGRLNDDQRLLAWAEWAESAIASEDRALPGFPPKGA